MFLYISVLGQTNNFQWPDGRKAAISLSFDDARKSHPTVGKDLFRAIGGKVTFYVVPSGMEGQIDGWKEIVADGHEIGNHTIYHPCTGNFAWAKDKALENYTLSTMREELLLANRKIKETLGVDPVSFAYTCGNTFVGRGSNTKSYAPLVAELFENGRGWLNESSNDPYFADLSLLQGVEMDGKDFEQDIKPMVDQAIENGTWLLLAGHEIGESGRQTTRVEMLKKLMAYIEEKASDLWLAPVGPIAKYVEESREMEASDLRDALTFCASFDDGFDADFALGDGDVFGVLDQSRLDLAVKGLIPREIGLAEGRGRFGTALEFKRRAKSSVFFNAEDNFKYDPSGFSGTISLWLSLDPGIDLAPGYTDPFQVTDSGYDDNALWVDFTKDNPRDFRMGVFGDVVAWNPKKISADENKDFINRLVVTKENYFRRDRWTHVAVSFSDLNGNEGKASFYVNGILQGERKINESFSWDLDKTNIFLGINFVGLMDEFAVFNRALNGREISSLYQMAEGIQKVLKVE